MPLFIYILLGIIVTVAISFAISRLASGHSLPGTTTAVVLAALIIVGAVLEYKKDTASANGSSGRPPQNTPQQTYTPPPERSTPTLTGSPSDTTSDDNTSPTDTQATETSPTSPPPAYFATVAQLVRHDPRGGENSSNESMSIRGRVYSHAIREYSGCQNVDGGDYWTDYIVTDTWSRLTGVVGMSDAAKSLTPISWRIYLNNVIAQQGVAEYGQAASIDLSMKDIYTVRLWMNDPQAPKAVCGFGYIGSLAWGDLTLSP